MTFFSASKLFPPTAWETTSPSRTGRASTVLFPGKPMPDAILGTAQRFEPTLFFSVPTLYNAMSRGRQRLRPLLDPPVRLGGGGPPRRHLAAGKRCSAW